MASASPSMLVLIKVTMFRKIYSEVEYFIILYFFATIVKML